MILNVYRGILKAEYHTAPSFISRRRHPNFTLLFTRLSSVRLQVIFESVAPNTGAEVFREKCILGRRVIRVLALYFRHYFQILCFYRFYSE